MTEGGQQPELTAGPLHTFTETFSETISVTDGEFTAGRALNNAGRLELTSGWVDESDQLTVTTRFGGEVWFHRRSDLPDSWLSLELPAPNPAATAVTEVAVFRSISSPRTDALLWLMKRNPESPWGWTLEAVHRTGGVSTVVATLEVDPASTRWVRFSEDAGTVYWDTSPDGFSWDEAASAPSPAWTTDPYGVRVALGTWHNSPGDESLSALFDSLNVDLTAGDPATVTSADGDPYLAVDVQPDNITGAFRVGVSELGGMDRLAWSAVDPETWENVVCDVRAVHVRRGATRLQGVLTRTEAGTATITVLDTDSRFDPNQNAGAIRRSTPVRLRAWGYHVNGERWDAVLFTADLDDLDAQYLPDEDAPVVTLTAVDLVGILSSWESTGVPEPGAGAGDDLRDRVLRTLETVGRGELAASSSVNYTATLAPTQLQRPWDELAAAADAELGRLWVDKYNRLIARSRGSRPSGPVRGTLSDIHPDAELGVHCCMADATVVSGAEGMVNRALAGRIRLSTEQGDPTVVQLDDVHSQRLHGVASISRTSLPLETDAQLEAWAGALIGSRTRPELRVDSVAPRPALHDLDSALDAWPAVLRTDVGDRWLFQYHPPRGPAILRAVGVLGIELEATPEGWSVTWTTEDAPAPGTLNPTGWFVVGVSQVGSSDLLAPYSIPVPMAD